jgi:hypothetical protein
VTGIERNQRPKITDAAGVRRGQVGWDAVHIAIDDATRLAYAEVLPDEKAPRPSRSWAARWRSSSATASASSGC